MWREAVVTLFAPPFPASWNLPKGAERNHKHVSLATEI
jgi:hypothetical protein